MTVKKFSTFRNECILELKGLFVTSSSSVQTRKPRLRDVQKGHKVSSDHKADS